jgi:carboxypeptidase C (cathepsin A)
MPVHRLSLMFCLTVTLMSAQQDPPAATEAAKPAEVKKTEAAEEPPVITQHSIKIGARTLNYTATAGFLPIKNPEGEVEARIFYMAYTVEPPAGAARRPLMFSFNGGPGSSSVWLHLGAVGPKLVRMLPDGTQTAPPYQLVDNDQTWLDQTDLVFIDPVGTGYSRPAKKDLGKKFWSLKGDLDSVGEFIRMYLGRNQRWNSPLFLVGESYGTMRAAGLAGWLIDRGIALNGIVLVSSVLDFGTIDFVPGNDWPYVLYLPSYTATAWYHKRLPPDLQADLRAAVRQAEQWTMETYLPALAKGDRLSLAEKREIAAQLARLTGLSPRYVEQSDLRVEHTHFVKELLREQGLTAGRLDSRFTGKDQDVTGGTFEYDPSYTNIQAPYTMLLNEYVRRELGYQSDAYYNILGGLGERWDWGNAGDGLPFTADGLRRAFVRNPHMKVFIASGYYDLATPYFATMHTFDHMGLDAAAKANIRHGEYESGHMMYIHRPSLEQLRKDVRQFLESALPTR